MNKRDLKQTLKPLIKECIKEVILEEGLLSGIVAEVLVGVQSAGTVPLVESAPTRQVVPQNNEQEQLRARAEADRERRRQLMEKQHQMSKAIGKDSYNGVNLFEGTKPLSKGGTPDAPAGAAGALAGVDPNDPGVDISAFFGRR